MRAPSPPRDAGASAAHTPLTIGTRISDYGVAVLAVILGGGSVALFAWASRPVLVPMGLSGPAAVAWNVLVSCVFFVQHSVMVRRPVRARLSAIIPPRYDAAFYAITSGIALAVVCVLLQPSGTPLFVLHGAWRAIVIAAALLAVAGFAWGIVVLRSFDPLGLRPVLEHLRRRHAPAAPVRAKEFVVRGPYCFVRHPLYFSVIVLLWADPEMSAGRLALAAAWTAWIWIGTRLEERDLAREFGETYRRYCEQVPMLFAWRGRVRVQIDEVVETSRRRRQPACDVRPIARP